MQLRVLYYRVLNVNYVFISSDEGRCSMMNMVKVVEMMFGDGPRTAKSTGW